LVHPTLILDVVDIQFKLVVDAEGGGEQVVEIIGVDGFHWLGIFLHRGWLSFGVLDSCFRLHYESCKFVLWKRIIASAI